LIFVLNFRQFVEKTQLSILKNSRKTDKKSVYSGKKSLGDDDFSQNF